MTRWSESDQGSGDLPRKMWKTHGTRKWLDGFHRAQAITLRIEVCIIIHLSNIIVSLSIAIISRLSSHIYNQHDRYLSYSHHHHHHHHWHHHYHHLWQFNRKHGWADIIQIAQARVLSHGAGRLNIMINKDNLEIMTISCKDYQILSWWWSSIDGQQEWSEHDDHLVSSAFDHQLSLSVYFTALSSLLRKISANL